MSPRTAFIFMFLLFVGMMVSAFWVWSRLSPPSPPAVVASPTASTTPTLAPTVVHPPPGYRLAGVAVGEPHSYAVVEAPDGTNTLYRADADIPGLGRLLRIEAERIVVQGTEGQMELWLTPAATTTPTGVQTRGRRGAPRPTPTPKPPPRRARGGTAGGSTPSAAPDRPAS